MTGYGGGDKNTPAEIADGVDAATNPRRASGVLGTPDLRMSYSQPRLVSTGTTGGGSVAFESAGARVSAGGTDGDFAVLNGPNIADAHSFERIRVLTLFEPRAGTPYNDIHHVGVADGGGPRNIGAHLDLQDMVYRVGSTTAAAADPNRFPTLLEITIDYAAGETTFSTTGGTNESVTIAATPHNLTSGIVSTESTGTGEDTMCLYHRREVMK